MLEADLPVDPPVRLGSMQAYALCTVRNSAMMTIFWIIPGCWTSQFRYRVWRLRDEIADDIRRHRFEDETQARILLGDVEAAIRCAHQLSMVNMLIVFRLTRRHPPADAQGSRAWLDLSAVKDPNDAARLKR